MSTLEEDDPRDGRGTDWAGYRAMLRGPMRTFIPQLSLGSLLQMMTVVSVAGGLVWQTATWVTQIRADIRTEIAQRIDQNAAIARELVSGNATIARELAAGNAAIARELEARTAMIARDVETRLAQEMAFRKATLGEVTTQQVAIETTLARIDRSFQRLFAVLQPQPRR
jgi:hypothetical protein